VRSKPVSSLLSRLATFGALLVSLPVAANHELILGIDEGFEVCDGTLSTPGASIGGCNVSELTVAFDQAGGSYMWLDLNGDGNFGGDSDDPTPDTNEIKALLVGPDGGLWVGDEQIANGSHAGLPVAFGGTGSENPSIDSPFYFFGNTAMYYTDVSTGQGGIATYGVAPTFITNDGSSATMDLTSLRATWHNGVSSSFHDLSGQLSGGSGIATVDCTPKPCAAGSTYVLDYSAALPTGDPFAGIQWNIHLEGAITSSGDVTPPAESANTGSTLDNGATDTLTQAELEYLDDTDAPAAVSYSVTLAPTNGQLELTTGPGVTVTAFSQDDINNNRLVYVHDGSATNSDTFDFTVSDSATNTTLSNTFTLVVGMASISVQPQDVKAALEWLPGDLANTPSSLFTSMQVQLTGDIATGDVIRIDLPAKGNRKTISDAHTGTGAAFSDPRTAVLDEANNRAIVSDNALPGLVAVNLTSGARTVFSQDGVAGTGPAFTTPGRLRLDAANNRILVSDSVKIIAADLTTGNRSIISDNSGSFGTGPNFQQIRGVAVDAANSRLLVADELLNAVLAVDPVTGDRTLFSDINNGTGTNFGNLRDVVIDTPNNRALVSDVALDAIFAVDLTTGPGDRTIISQFSTSTGTGPDFGDPTHLALDPASQRLLVAAYENLAIFAVDLTPGPTTEGNRSIISSNDTTAGPAFVRQRGIVLQASENRALVVDTNAQTLLAVDLSPVVGERTYLSKGAVGVGSGTDFGTGVIDVTLDAASNRAFVTDNIADAVWVVDMDNGNRTVLADATTGSGPALSNPAFLALDEATGILYVAGSNVLYAMDSTTGNRTVVSGGTTGSGPWGSGHDDIALDKANNRVLFVEGFSDRILAVAIDSGVRTILSDNLGAGTGPAFERPVGIVVDAANNRALVTDYTSGGVDGRLFAVDLTPGPTTEGNRSIISDNSTGSGTQLGVVQHLALDEKNDRVYVANNNESYYTINLGTGDRDQFYNSGGPGPDLLSGGGLVYDIAHGRLLVPDTQLDAVLTLDIYDPAFGSNPAATLANTLSIPFDLVSDPTGASYAEWSNSGGSFTGPVTVIFDDMRMNLTGAPVSEVIDYTFNLKDSGGNTLKATPLVSGPAFTMVNAITATVTPSVDTLDAAQGNQYFTDGIADVIASDIFIELDNNATLNTLGEEELAIRLSGDFTGISRVAASIANYPAESGLIRAETATNGNFTVLDASGNTSGGTNDVTATWDGTLNTVVSGTNFNMTIASASNQTFFGFPWTVHHARMFGPGTYSFDSDCTGDDYDLDIHSCGDGPYTTLTVEAGQVGAHLLFEWNGNTDIHVAMLWDVGSASDFASGGSGLLYTGPAGSATSGQLYQLISRDGDGDGTQGFDMVNGPFVGFSVNFNLDLFAGDGTLDEFSLPPGPGVATAFLVGGFTEETAKDFHLRLELDGTTTQTARDFEVYVDVLSSPAITAPASVVAPVTAATFEPALDTDGDGLDDLTEASLGTDPNLVDTDGDGISDYDEVNGDNDPFDYTPGSDTDPLNPDTDGDSYLDGAELQFGSDPLSAGSLPGSPLRMSTDSNGDEGSDRSFDSAISGDGRYTVFSSDASDLVANDLNSTADVFIKDALTGVTTRVSTDSSGLESDGDSFDPVISYDGGYVVFASTATNLVAGDGNASQDIFMKDIQTGMTTRISTGTAGLESNSLSELASVSSDGRYVAFRSFATNLGDGGSPVIDVFLKDTQTDVTTFISSDSSGTAGDGNSFKPAISADGRFVAFTSNSTNLVTGDGNATADIFIKDTQTGETTRASTDSDGLESDGPSILPTISANGRYVVFESDATNLVASDGNNQSDIFVKDTETGITTRVSTDSNGLEGNARSEWPEISFSGRFVVFQTSANNLVPDDTNSATDILVKDVVTGVTTRVSTDGGGIEGDSFSFEPVISSDGQYVAFHSIATNLTSGDGNTVDDVFRVLTPGWQLDSDNDMLFDSEDPDDDNDGMPDSFEATYGFDPLDPADATTDSDSDGYDNESEFRYGTDPTDGAGNNDPDNLAQLHYKILANDGSADDYFGYSSVSISGDIAVIGAYLEDENGTGSGAAYVYLNDGAGNWSQQAKLTASDAAAGDEFGNSVSVSGDLVAIGAIKDDSASGSVYIFVRNAGVWSEQAKLTASDGAANHYFGSSVSLSGDTAVIGARGDADNGADSGSAYIFVDDGAGNWSEQDKLLPADGAGGDLFGFSVSITADKAVIGANANDDAGTQSGSAYIFVNDGAGNWSQQAKLTASDAAAGDEFGNSVSISGNTALIAAYFDDDNGSDSGSAYVFVDDGAGNWSEQDKLIASDGGVNQYLGYSLSIYGDVAVISGYVDDDNGPGAGSVYLFIRNAGIWTQEIKLLANDGTANDFFGISASISDNIVVVGAAGDDDNGSFSGSAYVFELADTDSDGVPDIVDDFPNDPNESEDFDADGIGNNADPDDDNDGMPDSFEITHGLDPLDPSDASADADGDGYDNESEFRAGTDPNNNGESPGTVAALHYKILANDGSFLDAFGWGVDIEGDTALIGAYGADASQGAAYVYTRDGLGNWHLQQKLTAADGEADDYFGREVIIDGDTALIGAAGDDDNGEDAGAAYVFTRSGTVWTQRVKLTASDGVAFDYLGDRGNLALDGGTALIGTSWRGGGTGAVYVFTGSGASWSEQAKLTASDGEVADYFGFGVALDNGTAVIAAGLDDDNGSDSGSVYIFTGSGASWTQRTKLTASDGAQDDQLGYGTVSIDGDTVVVGSPGDDDLGAESGSVYVFTGSGASWVEQAKLGASDGAAGDAFGYDVALSGNTVLISTPYNDDKGSDAGAAYVFVRDGQGSWSQHQTLTAQNGSADDFFGWWATLSGDRALVSAPYDDDTRTDAGAAFLFDLTLPPVANNDTDTVGEGASKVLDLATNDSDDNGDLDLTSIVITSQPANRATDVVVNADGTVYYTHDGSETTDDSFTYTINDLNGTSSTAATVDLTITAANDAPVLDLDGGVAGINFATLFTEGAGGVAIANTDVVNTATLTDADPGDQIEGATLMISSPTAEDLLEIPGGQASIDAINTSIIGLGLTGGTAITLGGSASPTDYLAVIKLVRYNNTSSQPDIPPTRTVTVAVNDGDVSSSFAATNITIISVNSDFTASDDNYVVDEDTVNNYLNVTSNDIDPDGTEPVITSIVTPPANGLAVPSGDGHSIFYTPAENFSGVDTIVYEASDGGFTHQATVTITVNNQNDRPVLDLDGVAGGSTGYATAFTEGSGAVALTGGAVITDLDSTNMQSATIALNPAKTGDLLFIEGTATNLPAGITAVEATDGSYIQLTGSPLAPTASWEQALDLIRFDNGLVDPDVTQRSVAFIVLDESGDVSLAAFTTIDILVDDDPPLLDLDADGAGTGYATNFVTGQGSSGVAVVDSDVSIIDDGALITAASVSITNALGGDALTVGSLPAGISASGAGTASVSLSGDASAADYQSALAAIDFSNSLPAPSLTTRVIDVSVTDDGSNISNTATTTASLEAAPIVDLNGTDAGESFSTRFTIGSNTAVAVADTDADILDADSTSLTRLAITLANPAAGDQLTVDTAQLNLLGIAVDAASTSTSKLLTGTASKDDYTSALAYVGFLNTETVPAPAARLIKFVATDTDLHQGLPAVTTVGIGSDFAITFEPLPEIVLADATLTYTINVTNVGTAPATDLVLTSVLDEDAFITGILDPNSAGWDCSDFQSGANPTAVCSLPSLLQGATVSLAVEIMTPAVTKEIINSITVTNNDPLLGTGTAAQSNLVVNFLDGTGFLPEQKVTDTDGTTVFGDSSADFGSSVVLRDDLLIVGSPDDFDGTSDGNGVQSGAVVIYQRLPSGWVQLQRLVKPDAVMPRVAGDEFGRSLAWDGNWLVVGAPGAGEVYVYDSGFANPQSMTIIDGSASADNGFGRAVAISNSRIAVGSPRADINGSNNGRVYLFEENAGAWAQAGSVDSVPVSAVTGIPADNSDFGAALALQGDRLVIGAPYENGLVSQGVALLYEYTGGSWVYQQALLKPTIDKPDAFGRSLDIDGDSIVVGAMFHDSSHPDSGAAHVFSRDATGNWNHDQKLVASNAISGEEFGISVDLQGDTLLVGAYNGLNPIPNFISGVAYVFQRTGSVWNEQQIVSATDAELDDRFGLAVAMDGDRIALGAPADDDNGLPNSGSVYIFRIRSNSANKLFAFDRTVDAEFGTTLAVSGDTLVVGAPYHDHVVANNDNKGAAYVYRRVDESWELEQQLLASNAVNDDHFGWSVDISGNRIVVGAPGRDGTFANSGAAYTYTRIGTAWIGQQQLGGQSPALNDEFGAAVAIDGDRIAVGVPGRAATIMLVPLQDAGVVEVFDFGGIWTYQTRLVATTITTGFGRLLDVEGDIIVAAALNSNAYVFENSSGWTIHSQLSAGVTSVAMFGDQASSALVAGDTIVLGAANDDAVDQEDTGAVNSYRWNGGSWTDIGKLYADDAAANARFGASIALFGDQLLVGAPGDSEAANDAGAAYLYKSVAGDWVQRGKILINDAEQDDALGGGSPTAVAINLDGRILGAYREDVGGSGTNFGSVYTSFTTPGSSLPTGSFSANQLVTLECDDCADIYYTTNGSTPTTSSTRYTGAITIEAVGGFTTTTNLRFIAVDSQGNSSSVQTTSLLIDVEDPTVAIDPASSPYQNGGLVDTALLPIQGVAADEAGGSGLRQVQLELRDAAGEYVLIDEAGVFQGMTSTQTWLTATTTDGWVTWTLPITTVPFVEGGTYSLRVRGYDQAGNVSDFINTGFTYFTGTAAFMTLDLNLSASSILNRLGDSETGEGEIDASVKLTDPSDLGTDLTDSSISLDITDPNGVVTVIPLVTNINGQQTLQDLGDDSLIDFNVEGAWTLQAHYPGTTTRNPAESAPLTLLVGQSAGSAVIVVGRLGSNEGLRSHNKTGKRIYDILIDRGLQAGDIEFYSPDTNRDGIIDQLDGVGCDDDDGCNDDIGGLPNGIDAIPSRANVQAAIEGMAGLSNSVPAPRYVFMVDHGSQTAFLLNESETITPMDLDGWLDTQENALTGDALTKPSVVVLGMCYSGSFLPVTAVDDNNNPSPVDRVVIASAAPDEESYKGTEESDGIRVGEFFLEEFVKEAGRGASLRAAFEYATTQTEIFTRKSDIATPDPLFNDVAAQHPLLEDNRLFDPVQLAANNLLKSSATADGALSDKLYLGVGPTYATNAVSNPADIIAVTETVFLSAGEDSRLLTLTTNDDTKVASAWIEVRAPATQLTPSGGSIQLDPVLTRSIMNPPITDTLESWFTSYDQFTLSGKYEIFYFVEDATSGEISPIRRSIVYRNTTGNGDPAAPGLLLPADMATTDNEILFDWSESIDPEVDSVTYTLEISTDDTFATVDYREEEITNTYTFVGPQAGLQDLTTYHWRVTAVDAFGGRGISSGFSFTTDLTNALRGVVFATVSNAISDVLLQGATVIAVNDSGGTVAPLETAYMPDGAGGTFYRKYPDGVYDITITGVEGFAPATEEGVDVSVNQQSYATILPVASADADGDGIDDSVETINGTNPNSVDTDQDGIVDGVGGVVLTGDYPTGGGYPLPVDTNGDGYVDGEQDFGNDPTVADYADGNIAPYPVPDTTLNIADYLVATRIVLSGTPIAADSPAALGHIDMNADGVVNAGDLVLLLQAIKSQ